MSKSIDLKTPEGRQSFYNTKEWKSIRILVLREHPWCLECLKDGITTLASDVDHIEPLEKHPERCFDFSNLQSLCKSHHSRKTFNEIETSFGKKKEYKVVNKKWN